MKNAVAAFFVGLIFAVGLVISGMTQPQKVIAFLDIFGNWDPSLIFVMGGAMGLHLITYRIVRKRSSPLLDVKWHVPTKTKITPQLVLGSILFGIGWGLAGYCPGPALTSLVSFSQSSFVFVGMMFLGMFLYYKVEKKIKWER
jgi:uncharacterized protein